MFSQNDIYCRKCGNEDYGTFMVHRISNSPCRGQLSMTELIMADSGSLKIVRCGNCGHDMLLSSADKFVRDLK